MTRPTKNLVIAKLVRREAKTALRLGPWIAVSILLVASFWQTDLAAVGGLFQSPQDTPTPTLTLTPTLTPTSGTGPSTPETPVATATSIPVVTPTETAEAPAPTVTPAESPQPSPSPTLPDSTPTAVAPPTQTPEPSATPTPENERYPEGESDLRFEWGMLFDSVALGLSYIWLCCGVLVLFGIPAFFLVLWVAGRRQRQRKE
jgi:outer membrane biosynthesis protein TonB